MPGDTRQDSPVRDAGEAAPPAPTVELDHHHAGKHVMAVYTVHYPIHTYEVDAHGRATFAALFRFLQDSAAAHATEIGYGLDDMKAHETLWVLSRLLFRLNRAPEWRETLRIDTWPSGTERIFALRDWLVTDEQGEDIAIATSGWVVIDLYRRSPVRVERVAERMDMVVDRHLFERSAGKVPAFDAGDPSHTVRVGYADLDLNGHVNSTRYVEWMFEGLPAGLRESGAQLSEIEINFSGECRSGDELSIFTVPGSPATGLAGEDGPPWPQQGSEPAREFLHSVVKGETGDVVARARSEWRRGSKKT